MLADEVVSKTNAQKHAPCYADLLEVYAEPNSPLTEQIQSSGKIGIRFTREDGDLSTPEGRSKLWKLIDRWQPKHIWVAPECGPWGNWSRFNQQRSTQTFDLIQRQRNEQLEHLKLCDSLCEYQINHQRHFHMEQPAGSEAFLTNSGQRICQRTHRCTVDMCSLGLKIPQTKLFLRKRTQLQTTSKQICEAMKEHLCQKDHEHQAIAGSFKGRQGSVKLSRFCATYCKGFVKLVAKSIDQCEVLAPWQTVLVAGRVRPIIEPSPSDPRAKRIRFEHVASESPELEEQHERPHVDEPEAKRLRSVAAAPSNEATDRSLNKPYEKLESEDWEHVFKLASKIAPRVGNILIPRDQEMIQCLTKLLPNLSLHAVFACRGTDRMQMPTGMPKPSEAPLRTTIILHRLEHEMWNLGTENWVELKRFERIRKKHPSRLTLTIFSHQNASSSLEKAPVEPAPRKLRSEAPEPPMPNAPIVASKSVPEICEGWGPPPIPLHGPAFRALTTDEKSTLVKLHKNLGHPDPERLSEHLKLQGAKPEVVAGAKDFVCDACVESTQTRHQRPAKLHDPRDFNETVGIDGFFWSGRSGFEVYVIHCVDECSTFQLARRMQTRNADSTIDAFREFWLNWAGPPQQIYTDPAGEFVSQTWSDFLQEQNIEVFTSTEAWQKGRVERHGAILKDMLSRIDIDHPIENLGDFDKFLSLCCQAKNQLARHQGFSPEQIVLGKSTRLPASLTSDETLSAHAMSLGNEPESEHFRRALEQRTLARKAFLQSDNEQAIRRAMLRRSCPVRGPFQPGQLVMYWMKRGKGTRLETGRWHGPAKVIQQEGQSIVWVSHLNKILRCPPESLRPASLREWNSFELSNRKEAPAVNQPNREGEPHQPEILVRSPVERANLDNISQYSPSLRSQPEREVTPHFDEHLPEETSHDEKDQPPDIENPAIEDFAVPESNIEDQDVPTEVEELPPEEEGEETSYLACHQIEQEDLFHFDILDDARHSHEPQDVSAQQKVRLLEDGYPEIEQPLQTDECQAFCVEIPMNASSMQEWWKETNAHKMVCVAAAGKRNRSEVYVKDLTPSELELFKLAKDKELNCWIQTSAIRAILRQRLNPEQILKSRWVLNWKVDEEGGKRAKARLVVLGYQDPRLTEMTRDSPTLTKEGRATILQCVSSYHFDLISFDITTAFLRGKADSSNPLAMEPPPELRQKLGLKSTEVCELVGNAYGRVDAPLLFYQELSKQLHRLGFSKHPLDPCVYHLKTTDRKSGQETLHGILGMHVDDGVGGGDSMFRSKIEELRKTLPFGSFKEKKFRFTGIDLEQLPDYSIRASQGNYIDKITAIDIGKPKRERPYEALDNKDLSKLRGLIGSLQYAITHTRPDMVSKLGEVQCQMSKPTIQTMLMANKVLREAQETRDMSITFRSIPISELTFISFGDASFASPNNLASFQGTLICATNTHLNKNEKAPISPMTWSSKKISRVVRSTLSAEAYSMSRSVDKLGWMRLFWGCLVIPNFDWRNPQRGFQQLNEAIICTDCKSLFDLVTRNAMPACEEYRTTLEVLLLKERCAEHCHFRWLPTTLMLADPLTKPMDSGLLRTALMTGQFQIFDEASVLRFNAHKKEALSWLRKDSKNR